MIKSVGFFISKLLIFFMCNFDFIEVQIFKHNPIHRNLTDLTLKNQSELIFREVLETLTTLVIV